MGMIDQIIDFNKSFVTQEVYEKHLYIFIFIALFLCSCGNHKADVATFSDVQFCGDFAAIFCPNMEKFSRNGKSLFALKYS